MTDQFDEKWSLALQSLYGSVVKEERYADFLDQVHALIRSRFLIVGMFDPYNRQNVHRFAAPRAIGSAGAAEYLALAAQTHEEGMQQMLSVGPQKVLLGIDVYDDQESLQKVPTMKLLREKYEATHIGSVNAQPNNAWVDYVMFAYDQSTDHEHEKIRQAVAYFVPHIGVASEVRRAFKQLEDRYRAIFSSLNAFRYGVALITDDGHLLLANTAFETMLERRDGLRVTADKKLIARNENSNTVFQSALKQTLQAANGQDSLYRHTVRVNRADGMAPYILDFSPFCDDIAGELNVRIEGALLFMVDPEEPALLSHKGLAAAFQFTPAESSVCRQVLDGFSNGNIADANNVTLPTVKTQVSAIYSKTRVTDRSGLMRLASKVTPPLKDDD